MSSVLTLILALAMAPAAAGASAGRPAPPLSAAAVRAGALNAVPDARFFDSVPGGETKPPPAASCDVLWARPYTTLSLKAPGVLANDHSDGNGALSARVVAIRFSPRYHPYVLKPDGSLQFKATKPGHQTLIYQAVAADGQTSAGTTAIVYVQASKPHFGRSACGGGQADVSVDLRGPRKAVRPGTSITMTAIIFNRGPIPAMNVRFTASASPFLRIEGKPRPGKGACTAATKFTCRFSSIERGTTRTIRWTMRVTGPAATRKVTATASAASSDPRLANNITTALVRIRPSNAAVRAATGR